MVDNLNADLLDGNEASAFATSSHTHTQQIVETVANNTGTGMSKGDVCYISGDSSGTPEVTLADADAESTCSKMLVMLNEAIANSATGEAMVVGEVSGFTGLTAGAIQYVSATAGEVTETAPSTTGQIVRIAGYAISTTEIYFNPDITYIEIA